MTEFKSYALLGSGRLARHLQFYLKTLDLPVCFWSRSGQAEFNTFQDREPIERLRQTLDGASHILLAVTDSAVAELACQMPRERHVCVHFSGVLNLPHIPSAHPLMTFGPELEQPEWYRRVPFVVDADHAFSELLPGLPNSSWPIVPELRPVYHALCSLAGNATFLLWREIGDEFEKSLGLPRQLLAPFLHQVVINSTQYAQAGFTGPVARQDWETVRTHLRSLQSRPDLLKAYRGYLELAAESGYPTPFPLQEVLT